MKIILSALAVLATGISARAATTIDPANHYAYGANLGWTDGRGNTTNGAVIGEYVCAGYIYSANAGWINLGNGAPTNGIYYQNLSANDFGVNQDGVGNLRGYAYGANIGWIQFETNGTPHVDLMTGKMMGYAWGANCGWISLSNAIAFVQTDAIARGTDSNGDGIPDAWELQNFGTLSIDPNGDPDHDGMSNLQEYLAGSDPNNVDDSLRITFIARSNSPPNNITLHWTSEPTRFYTIQFRETLDTNSVWADTLSVGLGASNTVFNTGHTNETEFYRIRAFRPLTP
jgi:hypothetical protein